MKKLFFLLLIPFGCLQVFSQNHEETRLKKVLYDNYGRVIQNENGEKIKFSYSETRELEKKGTNHSRTVKSIVTKILKQPKLIAVTQIGSLQ